MNERFSWVPTSEWPGLHDEFLLVAGVMRIKQEIIDKIEVALLRHRYTSAHF